MKRFCLSFLLILLAFSSFAQHPLEDGMSWTEVLSTLGYGSFRNGWQIGYEFYIQGDSLKDDIAYKKLYANGLSSWSSGRSEWWEEYTYFYTDTLIEYGLLGLVRMAFPTRLVFLRTNALSNEHRYHQIINNFSTSEEVILHEFDIELGDTLHFKEDAKVVQLVDSIEVADGKIVRRYWFNTQQGDPTYDYWLEGIGSIYGLFGAYTTDITLLTNMPFGLPRITLYCFESTNLSFPKSSNNYLRETCLRDVSTYFDSLNAPRILINEERRREREEQQEEEMEEEENFTSLQEVLDTIDILLYPNFLRRQDQTDQLRFRFSVDLSPEQINQVIAGIQLYDSAGQYYGKLADQEWAFLQLDDAFFMHKAGPGYYFVVFELTNGRQISKPLILQ
ncbi:MAG: hypothetical protein KTR30_30010 [Saprospiraceae bacterium]|nr:hypothetical protein [Saprospiraceae bacterium]